MRECFRRFSSFLIGALMVFTQSAMSSAPAAAQDSRSGAYVEFPGVKLWFTDSGGAGAPIVLLHANSGTSAAWVDQISGFSQAGYRVIAFDRRGWGRSMADPAGGPQPGSIAGDLDSLANYLKLDTFHLLGVAGGGFAALDYAAWHPERLRSLVVGGSTGAVSDKEVADVIARIEIPEIRKQPTAYREVGPSYRAANPDGTRRWAEIDEHSRQPGAPAQPLRTPNTFAKIATIPTATLVIAADADLLAPPALMRIWVAHLKNYEWADIHDAGHAMAWEKPGAFNDIVLDFLRRHSGP